MKLNCSRKAGYKIIIKKAHSSQLKAQSLETYVIIKVRIANQGTVG